MAIGTQTVVAGQRTTMETSAQNFHVRDVEDKIRLLQPYPTPIDNFFMLNDKVATAETKGIRGKFEWYEDAFLPSLSTLASGITGGSTTATVVTSGQYFRLNDLFIAEATGEIMRVNSTPTYSAPNQTFTAKLVGSGNITSVTSGTVLQRLAPAYEEGGAKGVSLTVVGVNKYGYPQIMKRLLSMSNRQTASATYGGSDWAYQWRKELMQLREEWERAMLNQGASYDDSSTGITYSAGFHSLTTNLMTYSGGVISKTTFDSAIKQCFTNGSTFELDAYCGGDALMDIAAFITNLLTIQQQSEKLRISEFGLLTSTPTDTKLVTYMHPMGKVNIYYNPQLRSGYTGDVLFIARENLKKRYMATDITGQPRKYRLELGIQTVGNDSYDAQYLMDNGLQIVLEETHGRLTRA